MTDPAADDQRIDSDGSAVAAVVRLVVLAAIFLLLPMLLLAATLPTEGCGGG